MAKNILYLQKQPCIRPIKIASELHKRDDVNLSFAFIDKSPSEFYGFGDDYFDKLIRFKTGEIDAYSDDTEDASKKITDIVKENNIDLIHCHNWPDFLTVAAIRAKVAPVIHDTHDLGTLGHQKLQRQYTLSHEKIANEESEGIVAVTDVVMDYLKNTYNSDNKKIVFNNYVVRDMLPLIAKEKIAKNDEIHLVYEGNVSSQDKHHYNLFKIFERICQDPRIKLHIFTARINEHTKKYEEFAELKNNVFFNGHYGTKELMEEMPKFDFGLSLFNNGLNQPHLDTVLANKTMEYVSCGIPVLTFPDKEQKRFVEEEKIGLVINRGEDVENLYSILKNKDTEEIKEIVRDRQFDFTVDANIDRLVEFYNSL